MTAYVTGTSTRKVDDLVKALGCTFGVSKSTVSRICKTSTPTSRCCALERSGINRSSTFGWTPPMSANTTTSCWVLLPGVSALVHLPKGWESEMVIP